MKKTIQLGIRTWGRRMEVPTNPPSLFLATSFNKTKSTVRHFKMKPTPQSNQLLLILFYERTLALFKNFFANSFFENSFSLSFICQD